MRALVGQKKRFLVGKQKNRDRTKRSRRSNAEVSLDNADAVIEGALPSRFSRVGGFWFLIEFSSSVGGIDADQSFGHRTEKNQTPDPSKKTEGSGTLKSQTNHSMLTYWSGIIQS